MLATLVETMYLFCLAGTINILWLVLYYICIYSNTSSWLQVPTLPEQHRLDIDQTTCFINQDLIQSLR